MDWLQKNRNIMLLQGIIFTLLGIMSVYLPIATTFGTELFIGWLLIFAGIIQLFRTFQPNYRLGFWSSLMLSILYIVFGGLFLTFPLIGVFSLTMIVIAFFLSEGIAKIIFGIQLKSFKQRGWLLANGIIALFMAFIIWSGWPETALWVIGLLIGINFIFFGISLVLLALSGPKPPITPSV